MLDVNKFVEETVVQNREIDARFEAREKKKIEAYMDQFNVNVEVPDEKKKQVPKRNKLAADKSADFSWLTKENMKKRWEEAKRKVEQEQKQKAEELAREKAAQKAMQEEIKAARQAAEKKSTQSQKVADALAASSPEVPKKEEKRAMPKPMPKSKAVIVSARKMQNQQIAFHSSFAAQLGIKQDPSKLLTKVQSAGKDRGR